MQNAKITVSKSVAKLAIIGLFLVPAGQVLAQTYSSYNAPASNSSSNLIGLSLGVSPGTICKGESASLFWSSENANNLSIDNGVGSVGNSGERTISPSQTTTYTITAHNPAGETRTTFTTINVNNCNTNTNSNDVTVNITADDTNIDEGDSTLVRWDSDNATSCNASGGTNGWSGSKATSGSFNTGDLSSDKTFSISCSNSNDSASDSVTINVDDNNSSNNGDQPDVTTKSASNIEETSATLRGEVDGNGSSTKVWFEWGRDRNDLSEDTSKENTGSGNETFDERISGLRRDTTYYFRAIAENDEGTDRGSIMSFRTDDNGSNSSNSGDLNAVTTPANVISTSSAQLNALILNDTGEDTDAWFQWGTNTNVSNRTRVENIGDNESVRHSQIISGLVPGITYYFRAVADNSEDQSTGSLMSFTTGSVLGTNTTNTTNTTNIRNVTSVVSGTGVNSLVRLTITDGSELITNSERREYKVNWENISNQTLRNVVVSVVLPESMSFEAASKGVFSNRDNTLAYDIETLSPGEKGELVLIANSGVTLTDEQLVVVVATLVYTDKNNVQDDVIAYVTHTAYTGGSVLGASAFGAGFLPNSLFGWLFLLILLLILVLLIKYLMDQKPRTQVIQIPPSH